MPTTVVLEHFERWLEPGALHARGASACERDDGRRSGAGTARVLRVRDELPFLLGVEFRALRLRA